MRAPLHTRIITALVLVLLTVAGVARAQQNPIVLKSVAETEVEAKNAHGGVEKKRVPLTKAPPGAEVIYTTTFTNQGAKPAGNVVVTNPVPANTSYVGGSARGENTVITFSVDGGKSYAAPDALTLRTTDGRERPALPSDYTHVRWVYKGDLPPGKTGAAEFRVVVK
jgi:uncharacterized repeat protein (TIGR01451 family)